MQFNRGYGNALHAAKESPVPDTGSPASTQVYEADLRLGVKVRERRRRGLRASGSPRASFCADRFGQQPMEVVSPDLSQR